MSARLFRLAAGPLGATLAGPAAALLVAPVLARTLGPEGRGELASVTAVIALLVGVLALGVPEYGLHVITRFGLVPGQLRGQALCALAVSAVLLLVLVVAGVIAVAIAGVVILSLLVQWRRAEVQGLGRVTVIYAERYVQALFRVLFLGLLLIVVDVPLDIVIVLAVLSTVAPAVVLLGRSAAVQNGEHETSPTASQVRAYTSVHRLLTFGSLIWVSALATAIVLRVDQLVIAAVAGKRELGLYAAAVGLSETLLLLSAALKPAMQRELARTQNLDALADTLRLLLLSLSVICVPVLVFAGSIIGTVYGAEFAEAVLPFRLLVLAGCFTVVVDVTVAALVVLGRPGTATVGTVAAAVVTAASLPLLARYGATGGALASLLAYAAAALTVTVLARRGQALGQRRRKTVIPEWLSVMSP